MVAGVFEGKGIIELIAVATSAVAVWAKAWAVPPSTGDYVDEITTRLRHPVRYAVRHPIQTIERKINTWFMGD